MRIAHVVWGMETGGVETMLVNIINEQVKTDKIALFIVNDFVNNSIVSGISSKCTIRRINRKPHSRDIWKPIFLNIQLLLFRPDIVHIHSGKISKLFKFKWKIVRTIHGFYNDPEDYSSMAALYAISDAVRDYTIKQGYPNVTTIPNGIDVKAIKSKKKYSHKEVIEIVQVGRLWTKAKGQDVLLYALAELKNNRNIGCFRMHFIGIGPSEKELKKLTTDLKLDDNVVFEGQKSQNYIYDNLCNFDLFIQPSKHDGFGLTVAEAMAARLPIIVSDFPGPYEVIDKGRCGMAFHNGDVNDLANKIESFILGNYDYRIVDEAHKRVCDLYDVSVTAKRYLEEYKKLL